MDRLTLSQPTCHCDFRMLARVAISQGVPSLHVVRPPEHGSRGLHHLALRPTWGAGDISRVSRASCEIFAAHPSLIAYIVELTHA